MLAARWSKCQKHCVLNYVFFIDFKLVHRRSLILSNALRCVHLSRMC